MYSVVYSLRTLLHKNTSCFVARSSLGCPLISFKELLTRRLQMLEMKLRDKVARSLFGGSIEEDSHIYLGTGQTCGPAHDRGRTGGVCFRVCWQRRQQLPRSVGSNAKNDQACDCRR